MAPPFHSLASNHHLRIRADLLKQLRAFFDSKDFFEVQTPVLSRFSVIDRHLDPVRLFLSTTVHETSPSDASNATCWYLQTSPEQSMKRLLASGCGSIYQVGPVFRAGEFGQFHNPEFTMAEWYEVGADYEQGLATLDALIQALLGTPACIRITFEQAFWDATQCHLYDLTIEDLARWCVLHGLVENIEWCDDWDDWVNLIFSERIQPKLGWNGPVLITNFPASQAALAKLSESDPRTAERYEAFFQGVELANGYHELADADVLKDRAILANLQREKDGKFVIPVDNPLLDAMKHGLPPSCGCALGFDRIVMLACGAKSLSEVVSFTSDRA